MSLQVIFLSLTSRVSVIIIALLASHFLIIRQVSSWSVDVPLVGLFVRWDSAYYLTISQHGFVEENLWAFRPIYPLFLRAVTLTNQPTWEFLSIVGFVVSNAFFVLAVYYLYKLTSLLFDKNTSWNSVKFFCLAPGTVYFSAIYPDSMYLFFLFSSFYFLEKSKYHISALFMTLAVLTRPEGVLVSLVYLFVNKIEMRKKKIRILLVRNVHYAIGLILIFMSYPIFALASSDLFRPIYSALKWDTWTIVQFLQPWWTTEPDFFPAIAAWLTLLLSAIAFSFGIKSFLRDNLSKYYIWSLCTFFVLVFVGDFRSLPRLSAQLIVVWWFFSQNKLRKGWLFLFALLSTLSTILFITWHPLL